MKHEHQHLEFQTRSLLPMKPSQRHVPGSMFLIRNLLDKYLQIKFWFYKYWSNTRCRNLPDPRTAIRQIMLGMTFEPVVPANLLAQSALSMVVACKNWRVAAKDPCHCVLPQPATTTAAPTPRWTDPTTTGETSPVKVKGTTVRSTQTSLKMLL